MNPDNESGPSLTHDEAVQLVTYLAERGHVDAAFCVARTVAYEAAVAASRAENTR